MKKIDLQQRINSFKYAFTGLFDLIKNETHAKIHLFVAFLVILAGIYFHLSILEWSLLTFAIVIVLSAEAFNTAIEYLTDLVSPDYHPIAGKTKDMAAAAVLITAIGAAIIGFLVFIPKIRLLLY